MKKLFEYITGKHKESDPEPAKGKYIYPFEHPNPNSVTVEINPIEGTHTGVFSGAIDFHLPLGTIVRAADKGVVVGPFHSGSTTHGSTPEFAECANLVTIRHPHTREYTQYIHLGPKLDVEVGQEVEQGQSLGVTGESGYMNGNHLHFFIFKADTNEHGFIGLKPTFKKT